MPPIPNPLDPILQIAANSEISHYGWHDNDPAPHGYIKGLALCFGRAYCKLKAEDPVAVEMAKAVVHANGDTMWEYRAEFQHAGMDNSVAGVNTLRHLFVLMMGLGIRESSGLYCRGRDTGAHNFTGEKAEAGLFQTSWNARTAHQLLPGIFEWYRQHPNTGWREIFSEGAHCNADDATNWGDEPGKSYQALSKSCPAFHVEFTGVALRNANGHWGPINNHTPQVVPAADRMFKQVQDAVDASDLCPALV